jgi:hypothetical protein
MLWATQSVAGGTGTYQISVGVDPDDRVGETNEINNVVTCMLDGGSYHVLGAEYRIEGGSRDLVGSIDGRTLAAKRPRGGDHAIRCDAST